MRLFFCVPLPREAKDRAAEALSVARASAAELSWTKPEQMHLTLAFLGEQPPEALERMYAAAQPCTALQPFEAALAGAGAFQNPRRAHVLWLGITDGASQLVELAARLCSGLREAGFELETRPFRPHLTVARVKRGNERDAERALRNVGAGEIARFAVVKLLLMKSELSPKGARHEEVRAFPLSGG